MLNKCWYKIAIIGCICGMLGAGCASKSKIGLGPAGEDIVSPEDTDIVLSERPEGGTLVTDVEFRNVQFAYDSFQIADSEIGKIEEVASYLRGNRRIRLVTEGHCDERGSREYNMSLGEHRALAVRAYLVGLGIESSRIHTKSYGEERPLNPGHNESAWRLNRRVEFILYR